MKRPNLALVLYSYLFLGGLTILLTLIMMIAAGNNFVIQGVVILIITLIIFLIISIRGFVKWRKYKKDNPGYKVHPLAIFFVALFVIGGISTFVVQFPNMYISLHIKAVIEPYVKDDFTDENVPMPDNPHFVFYNMDTKGFSAPNKKYYNCGTKNPDEANVVVAYSNDVEKNGKWVYANSGNYAGDAYEQCVYIFVIRTYDWALIDSTVVSEQMDYGKKNKKLDTKSIDGIDEVRYYLNDLFKD